MFVLLKLQNLHLCPSLFNFFHLLNFKPDFCHEMYDNILWSWQLVTLLSSSSSSPSPFKMLFPCSDLQTWPPLHFKCPLYVHNYSEWKFLTSLSSPTLSSFHSNLLLNSSLSVSRCLPPRIPLCLSVYSLYFLASESDPDIFCLSRLPHLCLYTIYLNKIIALYVKKHAQKMFFSPLPFNNSLCNAVTDVSQRSEGYLQLKHIHLFRLLYVCVCVLAGRKGD